jgi:hypothetical protein
LRLSWFDQIVPAYWLVRHDILSAQEHLNFSTLGSKLAAIQKVTLYEAVNMIQLGTMPLPAFLRLHPEAKITPEELATLKAYLAPWTPAPGGDGKTSAATAAVPSAIPTPVNLAAVQPEFDGFPFDPAFKSWKLISTTDRGDNNTFRFVLGNDIAVLAARTGTMPNAGLCRVKEPERLLIRCRAFDVRHSPTMLEGWIIHPLFL